jgi:hypothetical protein
LQSVKDAKPYLVAFSVLSGSYKWALEKAKIIKENLDIPVIFGSVHVFLNTEKALRKALYI